jgi:hypothetical protein
VAEGLGSGHRHGVGTRGAQRFDDGVLVAVDRDLPSVHIDALARHTGITRHAHAHHAITLAAATLERAGHVANCASATHHQHRGREFTLPAAACDDPSPDPPEEQQSRETGGQSDGEIAARELHPEDERHDGNEAEKIERRRNDALIFLEAGADHPPGACTEQGKKCDPRRAERDRDQRVTQCSEQSVDVGLLPAPPGGHPITGRSSGTGVDIRKVMCNIVVRVTNCGHDGRTLIVCLLPETRRRSSTSLHPDVDNPVYRSHVLRSGPDTLCD